jgi:K+ transporter
MEGTGMEMENMKLLYTFKEILLEESASVLKLMKLEEHKYDALKAVDINSLMKLNQFEEEIIFMLDQIEQRRKEIVQKIAVFMKCPVNVTLTELIGLLPDDIDAALKLELDVIRESIKKNTSKLEVTSRENAHMVQSNLDIINLTLSFANRNSVKETYDYRNKKDGRENRFLINHIA